MDRARAAVPAALFATLSIAGAALAARAPVAPASLDAAVTWPISTGLLLAELQTGGPSASDEFVEITNASAVPLDLAGLEVVYVTSSGGTVTRKASWSTSLLLDPGQHLLIANASGAFAALADVSYSGGFAATGGSVVLRVIGGAPIDAVGWGDAVNAFVEGTTAAAPPAGSSIERGPAGAGGNTVDTNDNGLDWLVQAAPNPQNLASPPVPAAAPSPTPDVSLDPGASATPVPTPAATATALPPTESPAPSAESSPPSPDPSPTPSPSPTPTPSPAPTLGPTLPPTPEPTATALPSPSAATVVPIGTARTQSDGTTATIAGVLTTALGALESGRKGFVQDATGGIAVYLDAATSAPIPAGTAVQVTGTLGDRYAERTIRATLGDVTVLGVDVLPAASAMLTGSIGESVEGVRVSLDGSTTGSPTAMADGLGILLDDGSGPVRVVIGADALGDTLLPSGTHVLVAGPVGQHDSSGTGLSAYRVQATLVGELVLVPPDPSPQPSGSIGPSPAATPLATPAPTTVPSSTPVPSPTSQPSSSPSPAPSTLPIANARLGSIGSTVTVAGVVTAEGGRLGTPPLIAIADGSGAIVVRVPEGVASPGRGVTIRVTGSLADPYGQLEVRPSASGFTITGIGAVPMPLELSADHLGEATEARLVEITGAAKRAPTKSTSGDLTVDLVDAAGRTFRVAIDASAGVTAADLPLDRPLRLTGIVGQHASRRGALDGYRVWLRDRGDVVLLAGPGPGASPGSGSSLSSIAGALAAPDGTDLTIEAVVTAGSSLLDASGRRIVVQDATGAIEVLIPTGSTPPALGSRVRLEGEKAHAYGAPRLRASRSSALGSGPGPAPAARTRALTERDEWRLVRLAGMIVSVSRTGDQWRAELRLVNGDRVPIVGQPGAAIPTTLIQVGRAATLVGIVKRPYPTATDRRWALLPRGRGDVAIGPAASGAEGGATGGSGTPANGNGAGGAAAAGSGSSDITPDTDLATLFEHVGTEVRVGGLVAGLTEDGFLLDDATATARIVLEGDAVTLLPHIRVGDALAARGVVRQEGEALWITVASASALVRVGDLGQAEAIASPASSGPVPSASAAIGRSLTEAGGLLPAEASLATLAGLTAVSLLVTFLRRRAAARRARAVVLARLATLTVRDRG